MDIKDKRGRTALAYATMFKRDAARRWRAAVHDQRHLHTTVHASKLRLHHNQCVAVRP